ncbi:MAG: HTH domain-containing protein [Paracoccaceae bacterium]
MSRNDRLFDLIQRLRDGRLHIARDLAGAHGVSVRTIWRDMATLAEAGLPVQGERGVGYILRGPITLPPMILTADEAEALQMGLGLAAALEDERIAKAAKGLGEKLAGLLPVTVPPEPA